MNQAIHKAAIIIICLNTAFEVVFQYRFQSEIEIVYFFIAAIVSIIMIKNTAENRSKKYLPVFYCFWPFIMICISAASFCKLALLPFLLSSFIILLCGRFKKKWIKVLVSAVNLAVLSLYLLFLWLAYFFLTSEHGIIKTVYSPDNKYIMVVEETDFSTGGDVSVYFGRNIDFGVLGHYTPRKRKYYGHTDERPELQFIDDNHIRINGRRIESKGNDYIDDY